ncbi:MAG: hypothetical protein EPGJADBJ_04882 [Saprospiraceae bacterium]|nr:hypothetical protein [Saprospiraceae bacterium]
MRLFFGVFSFLIISSCKQFLPQKPHIAREELPNECMELYDFIYAYWKKHRNNPCHEEIPNAFTFADRHRSCFEKLSRSQIEELLGPPDKVEFGIYVYFMKKDCRNMSPNGSYYLEISFKEEKVHKILSGYKELIE